MRDQPSGGYLISKKYAWYVFVLLCLLMMFDIADRLVINSLLPFLKLEWDLTDAQCGLVLAIVSWSIVAFALPVSVLADRWSRTKTIGIMSTLWGLATLACGFSHNFLQLLSFRALVGVGEAGYAPAGSAIIGGLFPERLRATLLAIFHASMPLGGALGVILGGYIGTHYGWRHAFGVVAVPGIIVALLFFFMRDYKTVELTITAQKNKDDELQTKRKMSKTEIFLALTFGTPTLLTIYIGNVFQMAAANGINQWLPTYFHRAYHLPMDQAGLKAGLLTLIQIISLPLIGILADKLAKKHDLAYMLTTILIPLFTFLSYFLAFFVFRGNSQYIFLLIGSSVAFAFFSTTYTAMINVSHPGLRGTVIGLSVIFNNLLGQGVGVLAAGFLSDQFGLEAAMKIITFTPLMAIPIYCVAACYYRRDKAKVEKVVLQVE